VLGRLGASHLSDYSASKAALIAMHNSLGAELQAYPNIKTILVAPGQLSTDMFADVKMGPVQNFFGPVVVVSEFAVQLVKMINEGKSGILAEPFYARWIGLLECLPAGAQKFARKLTGLDSAMQGFGARKRKDEADSEESVELI
jgi:short-subunit dehydrogenase